ncbi:UDP-N-acetylglucosamine pyrophosphorylase [Acanthamoeba polyphaga mimivirus]|uniref:UDP-N-acetylglucosamine diphosphorylase n=4 Tax=Megamimivirinae TaxID=3044648 RepID=A0A2L2DII3_MIMIV|nr:putative UDP-N-acetylglucosamine pyrophosphorylase [Megavirus chiliensis]AFX92275.1 putative UDP-N-acetylglucosamine pyrophosphorylase [Megavirus courdo11]AGD92144.1 putative UDP-N-acetylglucosamine pyrophosphorylase [Megavirus lba]AVG45975.1 UDP-N-acetylglucosamine pyrophosphorylase [Acanthamoeba polyphaga mimivirus]AEQ33208.1 UDP-N-acetylglucosamine pyrophosphorylase [Megavirus chiliensis]AVG47077.1 UDP-N-acetylglucosamine pyrophosphorylase [Acanthamoeba polyphaga mimivirus]
MNKLYITILAGGLGKRMQSNLPKVLHQVKGQAMIVRLIYQIIKLNPEKILIVVGKYRDIIQQEIEKNIIDSRIFYVDQLIPNGTGDAVKCTLPYFENNNIDNIILNGDVPMIQYTTIKDIYNCYSVNSKKLLITSINLSDPTNNGRIIVNDNGEFNGIIEEKDCNDQQKTISLVNCGIYVCNSGVLLNCIPKIDNNNIQHEYYLTDLVKIYRQFYETTIDLYVLPQDKEIEIYNVNTKQQLEYIEQLGI